MDELKKVDYIQRWRIEPKDEDVERYLGLSILGNIPNADSKKSGKYGYYKAYTAPKKKAPKQEAEEDK